MCSIGTEAHFLLLVYIAIFILILGILLLIAWQMNLGIILISICVITLNQTIVLFGLYLCSVNIYSINISRNKEFQRVSFSR